MAKYRIKNPEIEKAVRGLYANEEDFIREFNEHCKEQFGDDEPMIDLNLCPSECISGGFCQVQIKKKDIEEVVEYDPKKWNEYPKVKPPKKDIYRVNYHFESGEVKKESVYFDGENFVTSWFSMNGGVRTYFKPWDDEE